MMKRRQRILGITALALATANLVAMPHTLAALSEFSGGGMNLPPAMSNGGCGCSQPKVEVSPKKVKEILAQQRNNLLEYEWAQRKRPKPHGEGGVEIGFGIEVPIGGGGSGGSGSGGGSSGGSGGAGNIPMQCVVLALLCDTFNIDRVDIDYWCQGRAWYELPCYIAQLCPLSCGAHYLQGRTKTVYKCEDGGRTFIIHSCTAWSFVDCCDFAQAEPACGAGAHFVCQQ